MAFLVHFSGVRSSNAHVADAVERQKGCMLQALALNRFALAFKIGLALGLRELWLAMGRRCLECLDVAWAKKAYRQAPAAGMVMYLDRIQTVEELAKDDLAPGKLHRNREDMSDMRLKTSKRLRSQRVSMLRRISCCSAVMSRPSSGTS